MRHLYYMVLIIMLVAATCNAQIAVIVNKSNPITKIDAGKLADIYSLSTTKWPTGGKIVVYDNNETTIKRKFLNFINLDNLGLRKKWMQYQLSGEGSAPKAFESDYEIIRLVAATPGAIGFVNFSEIRDSDVKVIAKIE